MSKAQRVTWVLAGCCVALALLVVAQLSGLGSAYTLAEVETEARRAPKALALDAGARKLPDWPQYESQLIPRPLFNEDRKPTPVGASTDGTPEAKPLSVVLTGVILAGDMRIAMLREADGSKNYRLKSGQNLPGEQSAWKLVEIGARSAAFEASGQGRQELRLAVNDKQLVAVTPPPMSAPAPAAAAPQADGQPPPPPGTQTAETPADPFYGSRKLDMRKERAGSDEIRQRIEERRRQLREEAQRMSQQQPNEPQKQ